MRRYSAIAARVLLIATSLAAGVLWVSAPAVAQVAVSPGTVSVTLAQGDTARVALTVANVGADTAAFALSLAPVPQAGDPPEPPGTFLFSSAPGAAVFDPADLTMTPEGRLFAAGPGGRSETGEYTPALELVREFEHPTTTFLSGTLGVAYDPDTGRLWWLDVQGAPTERAALLEGDLDGMATGRRLDVPFADTALCAKTVGRPAYLAYAQAPQAPEAPPRFYYLDNKDITVWAMDTLGAVVDGYPVAMTDYARKPSPFNPKGCLISSGLDAHALGGEPVLEVVTGYPFIHPRNRAYTAVVTDREGRNRGAETPLFALPTPDGFAEVVTLYGGVRSRLDPSLLYLSVVTGTFGDFRDWVYAVRAAPLPPVWLRATPILFEAERGGEAELALRLDAAGLAPGVYEAVVSVREGGGIGEVLAEVPVVLTVPAVSGEDEAAVPVFALGEPHPNPSSGPVTVPLTLGRTAEARVVVFDMLGRRVATLAEGLLGAGAHTLMFEAGALPAGVYLVRATGDGFTSTRRFTLTR